MMPNVATVAAVASAPQHNVGSTGAAQNHRYGATTRRSAELLDDVYQSFSALSDDDDFLPTHPSPQCPLTLHAGTRQVAPTFVCLGGSALCLAVASYELTSSLLRGGKPDSAVGPLIAIATGLNVAAVFAARRIGAPIPEPENIVD